MVIFANRNQPLLHMICVDCKILACLLKITLGDFDGRALLTCFLHSVVTEDVFVAARSG